LAKFPTFSAQLPCNGTSKYISPSSETTEPVDAAQLQGDTLLEMSALLSSDVVNQSLN